MKCKHCGESTLKFVQGDQLYDENHFQCSNCDSTYPITEEDYKKVGDWFISEVLTKIITHDADRKPGSWINRHVSKEDRNKLEMLNSSFLQHVRIL